MTYINKIKQALYCFLVLYFKYKSIDKLPTPFQTRGVLEEIKNDVNELMNRHRAESLLWSNHYGLNGDANAMAIKTVRGERGPTNRIGPINLVN